MKNFMKQAKRRKVILFISVLFISLLAEPIYAEKGNLHFQFDRIEEEQESAETKQTELDKEFPQLFQADTSERIERSQRSNQADQEKLFNELFHIESYEDPLVEEVRNSLFSSTYEATNIKAEEAEASSGAPMEWMIPIIVLLTVIVMLYFITKYMTRTIQGKRVDNS